MTLKLRRIDRGIQFKSGQEWQWKGRMEKTRTRFNMEKERCLEEKGSLQLQELANIPEAIQRATTSSSSAAIT